MQILGLDVSGTPFKWLTIEEAVGYYATDKVIWELGDDVVTLNGGIQNSGIRSRISTKSIIAVKGETKHSLIKQNVSNNALLFRRDHNVCAYCGQEFSNAQLTRDHVYPKSKGGSNAWENSVTACRSCNMKKGNKTPEQAHMQLIYLPYRPCRWEGFILQNRHVIADQMQYLTSKLPKHSRHLYGNN